MRCPRVDAGSVHCAVEISWVNGMQHGEGVVLILSTSFLLLLFLHHKSPPRCVYNNNNIIFTYTIKIYTFLLPYASVRDIPLERDLAKGHRNCVKHVPPHNATASAARFCVPLGGWKLVTTIRSIDGGGKSS